MIIVMTQILISFLIKAIEKAADKDGVPAHYYYTLGDAYRMIKDPDNSMSAYEKAFCNCKKQTSVFYRMATLWMLC